MRAKSNKTIVLECYRKIIRDLDLTKVDSYITEDYVQHSPKVKDKRQGILEMLTLAKTHPKPAVVNPSPICRVVAEDDFVAVHLDLDITEERRAVIDLFRLKDGKIAEHWDAVQIQPGYGNSLITMTNGISVIEDTSDANRCKKIVKEFYDDLSAGNQDKTAKYFTSGFIEHNPFGSLSDQQVCNIKVHRIIGEGNFVVTQCECTYPNKKIARYNIFKIEDDNIAEHWSVEQVVPDSMAHNNGMF